MKDHRNWKELTKTDKHAVLIDMKNIIKKQKFRIMRIADQTQLKTWLKRELVNWKINMKILPTIQDKLELEVMQKVKRYEIIPHMC